MSQSTHFTPPLVVTDADDANTVWLALVAYKQKMYGRITEYRAEGKEDMARACEREAERAERLEKIAYTEYRNAKTREGERRD